MILFLSAWMLALATGSQEDCFVIEKQVAGDSLIGVIAPGQSIEVLSPACATPERYDYIIFRTNESENLVIKQIWGLPGDTLSVDEVGHVYVNKIKTLTPYDKPYVLMGLFRKKMKALEGPLEGYLALGHPGSIDSGKVGPIKTADIVGVVRREAGRQRSPSLLQ